MSKRFKPVKFLEGSGTATRRRRRVSHRWRSCDKNNFGLAIYTRINDLVNKNTQVAPFLPNYMLPPPPFVPKNSQDLINLMILNSETPFRDCQKLSGELINAVTELNNLVGMHHVKKTITQEILMWTQNTTTPLTEISPIVITGPKGSGKSTLARVLANIYKSLYPHFSLTIHDGVEVANRAKNTIIVADSDPTIRLPAYTTEELGLILTQMLRTRGLTLDHKVLIADIIAQNKVTYFHEQTVSLSVFADNVQKRHLVRVFGQANKGCVIEEDLIQALSETQPKPHQPELTMFL